MDITSKRGPASMDEPGPVNMRASLVLEAVAEMIRPRRFPTPVVQIRMGRQDQPGPNIWSGDELELIPLVARGEVDIATLNPSAVLTAAYEGKGPFAEPLPLRAITVMPSIDWIVFAVTEASGLTSLAQIKQRKYPLRVSIRGPRRNVVHMYIDEVLKAYGFSLQDIVAWGGSVVNTPYMPFAPERNGQVKTGEVEAIFDEGVGRFIPMVGDLGMRLLPLEEPILQQMDAIRLHRATIPRSMFPNLPADVPTLDFSGWPVYTRADAPDDLIYGFCRALDARRASIPWELPGPLPLGDMCRDTEAGPLRVPLHAAAQRYWREAGYL